MATRMVINAKKSFISFLGIEVKKNMIYFSNILPFKHIDLDSSSKYLGFYLIPNAYLKHD
jgi:hypothetical protein